MTYQNGAIYEGQFMKNMQSGKGRYYDDMVKYIGEWERDKYHGFGYE